MAGAKEYQVKKQAAASRSLMNHVFSWSISDILNKNLYKNKVPNIPLRFSSISEYKDSYVPALIEETHADLLSGITSLSTAPVFKIISVEEHPKQWQHHNFLYSIRVKGMRRSVKVADKDPDDDPDVLNSEEVDAAEEKYKPAGGDLIALTVVQPRRIDDLNSPGQPYTVALVDPNLNDGDKISVFTSKPIDCFKKYRHSKNGKRTMLFGVYLINMTTNLRIQAALSLASEKRSNILKTIVQGEHDAAERCPECLVDETSKTAVSTTNLMLRSHSFNESQEAAILSCIASSQCKHQNTIKLIWGPPGTGKTKTVGVLLYALIKLETKTLICGPTNTAVLQVAGRLLKLVRESCEIESYGLGDIVLFGNRERMGVDKENNELLDVFYNHRVGVLGTCFNPENGWRAGLKNLIHLLENSVELYTEYLKRQAARRAALKREAQKRKAEKRKSAKREAGKREAEKREPGKREAEKREAEKREAETETKVSVDDLIYTDFLMKELKPISVNLKFCIENLPTHLPSSTISLKVVKCMIQGKELLESLEDFLSPNQLSQKNKPSPTLPKMRLKLSIRTCLKIFKSLEQSFVLPEVLRQYGSMGRFCLARAQLVFCTASSAARLGPIPFRMLIIDEAGQLKECESLIPLQVSGLSHAVLIGDEKQLPAMVRSNISASVNFGRSLFERLVLLGHKKHLLNIQYRMHPSISRFPNKVFYNNLILDASSVRTRIYEKEVLDGRMFGTFSFINVSDGKEEFDAGYSLTNTMEVAVAFSIVTKLSKACAARKEKISVGVISPYKAQMYAIQNIFAESFPNDGETYCSVNVRSVDAFQGGEDDVIIISTVRSNIRGSVGFLSNHQRTNVALTRARHCLWILGNEQTLMSSDSIWKKLVVDAKERDSFYNLEDDPELSQFITDALLGLGRLDILLDTNSVALKSAKWKMHFSDDFVKSMKRTDSIKIQKSALELVEKLSTGWRANKSAKDVKVILKEGSTASELLELYKVRRGLYIAWSVDIQEEKSSCTQIIKVWDMLWPTEFPRLASRLDAVVGNYSVNMLNRCKYKCMEGTVAVPKRWPAGTTGSSSIGNELSGSFASLSLVENRNKNRNNRPKRRCYTNPTTSFAWKRKVICKSR